MTLSNKALEDANYPYLPGKCNCGDISICDRKCSDLYGEEISFERTIYQNRNVFKIYGSSGFKYPGKVSEEKDRILQHFSIEFNNPLIILQQDEVQSFFQTNDEKSLYNYFAVGSNLEQVEQEMKNSASEIHTYKLALDDDEKRQKNLQKQIQIKESERDQVLNRSKNLKELRGRLCWAKYHQNNKEKLKAEENLQKAEKRMNNFQEQLEKSKESLSENNEKSERCRHQLAKIKDSIDQLQVQEAHEEKELKGLKTKIQLTQERLDLIPFNKFDNERRINDHKEALKNCSNQSQINQQKEQETELNKKIKELTEEETKIKEEIKEKGNDRDTLDSRIREFDREIVQLKNESEKKEKERKAFINEINLAKKQAQETKLSRFGQDVVSLVHLIEKFRHNFTHFPIGPLGKFIKLTVKQDDLSSLLHVQLGSNLLKSFIVHTQQDLRLLQKLMQQIPGNFKPTVIFKAKEGKRYNISSGQVPYSNQYQRMLDFLEFTNDEVFNFVIDRIGCERIIVTEDLKAQKLFDSIQSVPKNTKCAITPTFGTY